MYSGVLEPDKVTFCRSEPNSKFSTTLIKVKLPLFGKIEQRWLKVLKIDFN